MGSGMMLIGVQQQLNNANNTIQQLRSQLILKDGMISCLHFRPMLYLCSIRLLPYLTLLFFCICDLSGHLLGSGSHARK